MLVELQAYATAEGCSVMSDDLVACDSLKKACDHMQYGYEKFIKSSKGQSCCCSPKGVKKGGGIDCCCDESAAPGSSEGAVCRTYWFLTVGPPREAETAKANRLTIRHSSSY
ncbi:unnamed protein product [Vitrella brassicaformis CCMP3155]|uniref:Uncharacterized protein n=1 Tax=Vitrella brassicaformis (strain CCMP3155) TaxID=1169540 RepID=A0A0G4GAM0_VITBC|nr:unnamed protein product [Vitrella brassicaformis CCMP3155]|eukprot:CEM26024.1 unnamed protein product [Vitrella brassicaformis CCMP3155]